MAGTDRWEQIKKRKSGRERAGRRLREWARAVKRRDHFTCLLCGKYDPDGMDADHIVPLKDGGEPYALSNGRTICVECHQKEESTGKGYSIVRNNILAENRHEFGRQITED